MGSDAGAPEIMYQANKSMSKTESQRMFCCSGNEDHIICQAHTARQRQSHGPLITTQEAGIKIKG